LRVAIERNKEYAFLIKKSETSHGTDYKEYI
jgi:hypothetical protein